jgi:hypothetical protein
MIGVFTDRLHESAVLHRLSCSTRTTIKLLRRGFNVEEEEDEYLELEPANIQHFKCIMQLEEGLKCIKNSCILFPMAPNHKEYDFYANMQGRVTQNPQVPSQPEMPFKKILLYIQATIGEQHQKIDTVRVDGDVRLIFAIPPRNLSLFKPICQSKPYYIWVV